VIADDRVELGGLRRDAPKVIDGPEARVEHIGGRVAGVVAFVLPADEVDDLLLPGRKPVRRADDLEGVVVGRVVGRARAVAEDLVDEAVAVDGAGDPVQVATEPLGAVDPRGLAVAIMVAEQADLEARGLGETDLRRRARGAGTQGEPRLELGRAGAFGARCPHPELVVPVTGPDRGERAALDGETAQVADEPVHADRGLASR